MQTTYFLNGVSSSGKTSIGKRLQAVLLEPYLHVQIDHFEDMMPERYREGGDFSWSVLFPKVLRGLHSSIAAIASAGNNLIVDHVMVYREGWDSSLGQCLESLQGHLVYFIGVHCSLEELKRREVARGDRFIGTVERQFPLVHRHGLYDVQVDTTHSSTDDCVSKILKFTQHQQPFAFDELRRRKGIECNVKW